jgi:23S rRNA pseudouridine2605 synthase
MPERLQKLIAQAGLTSRRKAEAWITQGRVLLNGRPAQLGDRADLNCDQVEVDGRKLARAEKQVTVLLNKPRGYVTTLDDPQGRAQVTDLISSIPQRLFPVGRLDYNTEGLLLLTNDGDLAQHLSHPRHHVRKTYLVKVSGLLGKEMIDRLQQGLVLEDGPTAPAEVARVRRVGTHCWFELSLYEGRNRQVRRMCEAIGLQVNRLKRIQLAFLDLSGVATGSYRRLRDAEVTRLKGQSFREVGDQT